MRHPLYTVAAALLSATPLASESAESQHEFRIPAQSLAGALQQLAKQAGRSLFFAEQTAAGKRSQAVNGHYSVRQALEKLLSGSGLNYSIGADGAIAVKPEPAQSGPVTLNKVTVTAAAAGEGETPGAYAVPRAFFATKTDTPIMETPVSVQVIPQQVLRDQQAFRVNRITDNVSGVYRGSFGGDLGVDHYIIRGFQTDVNYRDGVPVDSSTFYGNRETANIEQIEVLKGPSSILYGRAEPGGLVNLVTKQPLAEPYYFVGQQFGSYDFYRTTADATGPVTQDKSLLYRANLAYENRGSFRAHSSGESVFFAPVLRWNLSGRTQANLELEYRHQSDPFTYGWPAIGNRPAKLPRDFNVGSDLGTNMVADGVLVGLNWSHAFNDNWTLRHRFNSEIVNADTGNLVSATALASDNRTLSRTFFKTKNADSEKYYTSLNLTGKFNTFGADHTVLAGWDYLNYSLSGDGLGGNLPDLDIFNSRDIRVLPPYDPAFSYSYDNNTEWYGFYLQDQIRLPYGVHILGGFRYDNVTNTDQIINAETEAEDAVTPRAGVLWRPVRELSLYGSYMENFGAQNFNTGIGGSLLPPESAQQWELGIKTEWFDGRLQGSLSYYDLTKQNIGIPAPPPSIFSIPVGEVNNSGVELDISGEILPGWKMIGAYSYIDSEITKSNDNTEGNSLANVPRNGGSLWSTFEFLEGDLRGLKFGAGTVARSQRPGDNANTFQVPGYVTINLMTSYEFKVGKSRLIAQLNVDNLLDKYYFGSAGFDRTRVNIATPRTFLGSIKVEF